MPQRRARRYAPITRPRGESHGELALDANITGEIIDRPHLEREQLERELSEDFLTVGDRCPAQEHFPAHLQQYGIDRLAKCARAAAENLQFHAFNVELR